MSTLVIGKLCRVQRPVSPIPEILFLVPIAWVGTLLNHQITSHWCMPLKHDAHMFEFVFTLLLVHWVLLNLGMILWHIRAFRWLMPSACALKGRVSLLISSLQRWLGPHAQALQTGLRKFSTGFCVASFWGVLCVFIDFLLFFDRALHLSSRVLGPVVVVQVWLRLWYRWYHDLWVLQERLGLPLPLVKTSHNLARCLAHTIIFQKVDESVLFATFCTAAPIQKWLFVARFLRPRGRALGSYCIIQAVVQVGAKVRRVFIRPLSWFKLLHQVLIFADGLAALQAGIHVDTW